MFGRAEVWWRGKGFRSWLGNWEGFPVIEGDEVDIEVEGGPV